MTAFKSILPPNSTRFERALEESIYRGTNLDVEIDAIWSVSDVKANFLPYLAWSLGVEIWNEDMDKAQKQQVIREYLVIRSLRGTAGAIERAYKALGITATVIENPGGQPYRFLLKIEGQVITKQLKEAMERMTELLKPLRTRYGIDISIKVEPKMEMAALARVTAHARFLMEFPDVNA